MGALGSTEAAPQPMNDIANQLTPTAATDSTSWR